MAWKIERFVQIKRNFDLEKNGGHTPSSLGGWLIVVVRQADDMLAKF